MWWMDVVNGMFEFGGSLLVLNHCRVLYNDKVVRGVSLVSTILFTVWGIWNCAYYPSLDQWASFYGGLAIVAANTLWVGLMLYYGRGTNAQSQDGAAH